MAGKVRRLVESTRGRRCSVACALLVIGLGADSAGAATGDILIEYQASSGLTPEMLGWEHEGQCLRSDCPCPGYPCVGYPPCWWQGSQDLNKDTIPDNNCMLGIGCHRDDEHYNAPAEPLGIEGACHYTEWVAFDDGDDTSGRPLTNHESLIPNSPPWGAPTFPNAPPYPTLRIATGDGNRDSMGPGGGAGSLPAVATNNRNLGKVKIRKPFTIPQGVSTVTLVCKAAAGPRNYDNQFIEVRGNGRRFSFGVNGRPGDPDAGQFWYGEGGDSGASALGPLFGTRRVSVRFSGDPQTGGEFFIFRVIVRDNGTLTAYLNERPGSASSGDLNSATGPGTELLLTPKVTDETMWFDFVQILEGEVPPCCHDPVFDVDGDGDVDHDDFDSPGNEHDFMDCATGPAPAGQLPPDCRCLDVNDDGAIDSRDFGVFQRCLTIGGGPLKPACDD